METNVDILPVDILPVDILPVDILPVDILPVEWDELRSILTDMKACRESGDPEGYNKCVERLFAWRDMYPEEAFAVMKVLSEGGNEVIKHD